MEKHPSEFTLEDLTSRLRSSYELIYVDYRDNLEGREQEIQDHIHGKDMSFDFLWEWEADSRWDGVQYVIKELRKEICKEFDMEDDDLEDLFDKYGEELRYAIEERDSSTPFTDLARNTADPAMFYDTGVWIGPWGEDTDERVAEVKEALNIPADNNDFNEALEDMVENAGYGGRLVVYFNGDIDYWTNYQTLENAKSIHFSGIVNLAIVNHNNGSGWHTEIKHKFALPFNRENVFLDKTIKYNFTFAVCGMYNSWCESTGVKLSVEEVEGEAHRSAVNNHLDIEAEYNATYKAGGCTNGDMDIHRHRNTYYKNQIPCGTHCPHCGNFWID